MELTGEIRPGDLVWARDAMGELLPRRAISGVIDGVDVPVVWVTTESEWDEAEAAGRRPETWPWPCEDVTQREPNSQSVPRP